MSSEAVVPVLPRPSEKIAIISFMLVFLCGMVLGAVIMRAGAVHGSPPTASAGLSMSVGEWKQRLDLTDQQTDQLQSILDDFSHYYDNLLADGNSRIMQILNEDQRRKFKGLLDEHRK